MGNAISENYGYARIILFQYKHIIIIHLSVRVQKDYVVAFQLYVFRIGKLNQNENQKDKLRIYASNKTLKPVNLIHDGKLMQIYIYMCVCEITVAPLCRNECKYVFQASLIVSVLTDHNDIRYILLLISYQPYQFIRIICRSAYKMIIVRPKLSVNHSNRFAMCY